MPLRFVGTAISLSGPTGSKLKCEIIGDYYPFWWSITSGGARKDYRIKTAIIELNAATGEIFIDETKETILGSAGHALELKVNNPNTYNLKIVLVEDNLECYLQLKEVIKKRWKAVSIAQAEGQITSNNSNIYLLNKQLSDALDLIDKIKLGNTLALFYFDPLLMVEYETLERVAARRMRYFFKTGTEFIIFLFTSDWFQGRGEFCALPSTTNEETWTCGERKTVSGADKLFGDEIWRSRLLNKNPLQEKERIMIEEYKTRLNKWFRYVLALPFNPKEQQLFHLLICSNYETGIRMTRDEYSKKTGNPKYSPDVNQAFEKFKVHHPETFKRLTGRKRKPSEWKVLWRIIRQHEDGICDSYCEDLKSIEEPPKLKRILSWLLLKRYLEFFPVKNAWNWSVTRYKLNWTVVTSKLGVQPPPELKPISPEQFRAASKLIEGLPK